MYALHVVGGNGMACIMAGNAAAEIDVVCIALRLWTLCHSLCRDRVDSYATA